MGSEVYLKIANMLKVELRNVQKFGRPLDQVLENLIDALEYEATQAEEEKKKDDERLAEAWLISNRS